MKEIELVLVCGLKDVLQKQEGVLVMCKLKQMQTEMEFRTRFPVQEILVHVFILPWYGGWPKGSLLKNRSFSHLSQSQVFFKTLFISQFEYLVTIHPPLLIMASDM